MSTEQEKDINEMVKFAKDSIEFVKGEQDKIKELEERIIKAEKAMANAYAWPNDGDPRTEHVKTCLREYRNKYPEVYKPSVSISTIS